MIVTGLHIKVGLQDIAYLVVQLIYNYFIILSENYSQYSITGRFGINVFTSLNSNSNLQSISLLHPKLIRYENFKFKSMSNILEL